MRIWLCVIATLISTLVSAQETTRELDLGGTVTVGDVEGDEAGREALDAEPVLQGAEALPIDERPLPPRESQEYVPFLWERARLYHQKGLYLKACADFDALSAAAESLEAERAIVGRTYLACAQLRADQSDLSAAEALLQKSMSLVGEVDEMRRVHAAIARHRASSALAKGQIDEAIASFDRALQLEPDKTDKLKFAADLTYLARAADGRGENAVAQAALDAAIKYFPISREANDLKREMWLRANLWLMATAALLLVVLFIALFVFLRRARADQFAKAELDHLPGLREEVEAERLDAEDGG